MKKGDYILIVLIIIISVCSILYMTISTGNQLYIQKKVIIELDGKPYKEILIDEETSLIIDIEENNIKNKIHIENNKVFMEESNCNNQLCVKQGYIEKSNQMIVCLPNKLSVRIEGIDNEIDVISE